MLFGNRPSLDTIMETVKRLEDEINHVIPEN
jgi:hypothetical protein